MDSDSYASSFFVVFLLSTFKPFVITSLFLEIVERRNKEKRNKENKIKQLSFVLFYARLFYFVNKLYLYH